jgi:hypothetical protein
LFINKPANAANAVFNETLLDVIWQVVGRKLAFKKIVNYETLKWFKRYNYVSFFTTLYVFDICAHLLKVSLNITALWALDHRSSSFTTKGTLGFAWAVGSLHTTRRTVEIRFG